MDFAKKKAWMNAGSMASALGLVFYFVGQACALPGAVTGAVTLAAAALSLATLLLMAACRQDRGKEAVSGNRLVGQGALTVLLALAGAVVLKGGGAL